MNPYYFVTLYFILISSKGSFLFYEDVFWLPLFLFILFRQKKQLLNKENKKILSFSLLFLGLSIFQFFFSNRSAENFGSNIIFLLKYFLLAFMVASYLKDRFAEYLLKVMYFLAITSLICYAIQLIKFDFIYNIASIVTSLYPKANPDVLTKNFLIFTVSAHHTFRNAGFAWEPGAYGCFLVFTLFFSFYRSNFKFEKEQMVFSGAVITTLSTTAFLAFLILIFVVLRQRKVRLVYLMFLLLPLFLLIANISILTDKIENQIASDSDMINNLADRNAYYENENSRMPLNRFASMIFLFTQFGYKLIWGIGNKYEIFYSKHFSVNLSNGIFDYMSRFGLLGLIYYFKKSWYFFSKLYNKECAFYLLVILIILGFGEPVLLLPFFSILLFLNYKHFDQQKLDF